MANEPSFKKGFTVRELEGSFKKYGLEIALCGIFVLTAIFALIWGGAILTWSILLCMIFAIVGVLIPRSMHKTTTRCMKFIYKENVTSIIVAVVGILLAIFLPPVIFAVVGLLAGKSFSRGGQIEMAHFEPHEHDHGHSHNKAQGE